MTNGYCYIVGEFALLDKRGNIKAQSTVTGYSRIEPVNTDNQREYLYENAVNHARSKFLYDLHKPSDEDVDWAILDYGFKKVIETDEGFRKPVEFNKKLSKKARNRAEERVNIKVEEKRMEKNKMIKPEEKQAMFTKKYELSPQQQRDAEQYRDYMLYQQSLKDKKFQKWKKQQSKIKVVRHNVRNYLGMNNPASKELNLSKKSRPKKNEIFIDKSLKGRKKRQVIAHEIYEQQQMRKGLKYKQAHKKALKIEKKVK